MVLGEFGDAAGAVVEDEVARFASRAMRAIAERMISAM